MYRIKRSIGGRPLATPRLECSPEGEVASGWLAVGAGPGGGEGLVGADRDGEVGMQALIADAFGLAGHLGSVEHVQSPLRGGGISPSRVTASGV